MVLFGTSDLDIGKVATQHTTSEWYTYADWKSFFVSEDFTTTTTTPTTYYYDCNYF